jgi:putative membrane protein
MTLPATLSLLTAVLNGAAAVLLVAGFVAIRRGDRALHRRLMLSAFGASTLFLAVYLTRVGLTGTTRFPGEGALRMAYLAILASHTLLAVVLVPLVFGTLRRSLAGNFAGHRRVARVTFPIWVYVSITGVVVYLLLHHVRPGS